MTSILFYNFLDRVKLLEKFKATLLFLEWRASANLLILAARHNEDFTSGHDQKIGACGCRVARGPLWEQQRRLEFLPELDAVQEVVEEDAGHFLERVQLVRIPKARPASYECTHQILGNCNANGKSPS